MDVQSAGAVRAGGMFPRLTAMVLMTARQSTLERWLLAARYFSEYERNADTVVEAMSPDFVGTVS